MNQFKFGDNVRIFRVKNIQMIGNRNNSIVIGLDKEGEELIAAVQTGNVSSLTLTDNQKHLLQTLQENGFFNNTFNECQGIDTAYLHVNSTCNLHCLGCYSYVENRNKKQELSLEQWKKIIKNLKSKGIKNIVISGGEPFLREDLSEICRIIKEKSINLEVITNGTMPIEKYEKALCFIDALNISIDGYNSKTSFIRDKGIMSKVLSTVEELKNKVPLKLIVTLHKKNVPFMKEYEKLAKRLNVFMSFSIFTVDFNQDIFKEYKFDDNDFIDIGENITNSENGIVILDTPSEDVGITYREGCGFGKHGISVAYNGDIYPCHMLHCAECKMGNICEQSITDIMKKPNFDTKCITLDEIEECNICEYKYLCGGACRGRAYLFTGDIRKRDPYCLAARQFYDNFFAQYQSI